MLHSSAVNAHGLGARVAVGPAGITLAQPAVSTPPPVSLHLRIDDLTTAPVQQLVAEHLADMRAHSPADHAHALAVAGLQTPDVTFWTAWRDDALCGCGALRALDATTGEIKSMRTRAAFLGQGVGQAVLDEILREARARGYTHVYLETGTGQPFAAAHALYRKNGFDWCDAFGDYTASTFNVFMKKRLP
jgi:putative acetyltransferase